MKTKTIILGGLLMMTAHKVIGHEGSVTAKWSYRPAESRFLRMQERTLELPRLDGQRRVSTDVRMQKTIFVANLANELKSYLKQYEDREKRKSVGEELRKKISQIQAEVNQAPLLRSDKKIAEVMDLVRKLAQNMLESKEPVSGKFSEIRAVFAGGPATGGLGVTSGGGQDFGFFRKTVIDGYVPGRETLTVEGFFKEFDLSLSETQCDELICVHPAITLDPAGKKLFVQLAMNSNVRKENFSRKPLNVSLVIDISGSMSATDNTEKSRLEWAKDSAIRTINELNPDDVLSIVLFDSNSETLLKPQLVTNKESILELIRGLKTKGSTNLEAGLRDGYQFVSSKLPELQGYEHRVILISDAGLNTGATDEGTLLKLVTDYANEGIGLSALGLGLNFNQKFIHAITYSKGGNYVYVHSGKDMFRYFDAFNFLVTPVAYRFKANLEFNGIDAQLVKAYGIPTKENEPMHELINIQTLFFSEEGGTILLEYALR